MHAWNSSIRNRITFISRNHVLLCNLGSLKDVLENEAIQLDWNFRMSLIHDIVKVNATHTLMLRTHTEFT